MKPIITVDSERDLVLERIVDVSPDLVWRAWTTPELILRWFTPAPWQTVACEIDLRPGGLFRTVMRSPEGQDFPNVGSFLDIVPFTRLVWTDALLPGFRPASGAGSCLPFFMTGVIALEPHGTGTKYTAMALHSDSSGKKQHADMGFAEGWGKALDQLVEVCKSIPQTASQKA